MFGCSSSVYESNQPGLAFQLEETEHTSCRFWELFIFDHMRNMEDPYLFWSMWSCQFKDSATGEFSICPFQSWSMGGCQFKERESIQSPPLEGVPSVHFMAWSMGGCQFKDSATGGTSICPFHWFGFPCLLVHSENRGCAHARTN